LIYQKKKKEEEKKAIYSSQDRRYHPQVKKNHLVKHIPVK
jgi:hypothetical protein